MTLLEQLIAKRDEIRNIAKECGLKDVRVFGSVASGEEDEESDIDIVANRIEGTHLGLKTYAFPVKLEEMFGRRVDFVYEKNLHHIIKDKVLQEAVVI